MAKLVYIGGYGRSGSTLLEYLLTASSEVVACGEVERHLRRFGKRKVCTCGRLINKCPVWRDFRHKSGKLRGWRHEQLTLALLEHVSRNYTVMVDSSKTAWGSLRTPFQLAQKLGPDFLLVHLVRDPRGVCWSAMRAPFRGKTGESKPVPARRCLRATVGWTAANLTCETFGKIHPESYLRVRYEDLVRSPATIIHAILARVSIATLPSLDPSETADNRHQLYGNAMRFKPLSVADLKEDIAWKVAMPKAYQRLVAGLTWPLRWSYDYGSTAAP